MGMPADKAAFDRLKAVADKNIEAGDWTHGTLPFSTIPIPLDEDLSLEEMLKLVEDQPVSKRKQSERRRVE